MQRQAFGSNLAEDGIAKYSNSNPDQPTERRTLGREVAEHVVLRRRSVAVCRGRESGTRCLDHGVTWVLYIPVHRATTSALLPARSGAL